ncbi:hypothetical protein [Peribacillus frigoritolerans]|uniref:Uncharacterized protein n=1 Tax=Peribacillus castrilensis TaxID=2897690 RepID=A0AAW9N9M9_9BACI|nr:hypothetical protein [Peribacillus castrilensis]
MYISANLAMIIGKAWRENRLSDGWDKWTGVRGVVNSDRFEYCGQ